MGGENNSVLRYFVEREFWFRTRESLPGGMCDIPYVLTSNERFVIIFFWDYIYFGDLNERKMKWTQSIANEFRDNGRYAFLEGDINKERKLVNGFIREIMRKIQMIIPKEIIAIIIDHFVCECIHLIDIGLNEYKHWRIMVNDIIPDYKYGLL